MDSLHRLLRRQLRKLGGCVDAPPENWAGFLAAINDAYVQSDKDRLMVERSLELSSQELLQANAATLADLARFEILYEIALAMAGNTNPENNLDRAVAQCQKLLGAKITLLALPEAGSDSLPVWATAGDSLLPAGDYQLPAGGPLNDYLRQTESPPLVIEQNSSASIQVIPTKAAEHHGIVRGLVAPICSRYSGTGFICAMFGPEHTLNSRDLNSLALVGNLVAVEIDRTLSDGQLLMAKVTAENLNSNMETINQQLKTALREARHATERAEEANQAKSTFLANMSHELRTPLNAITGVPDLMMQTNLTADQRELAEMAKTASGQLVSIIDELLDFAKIESGNMQLEAIGFDFHQICDEAILLMTDSARKKSLSIACLFDPDVPSALIGDPVRIRQILLNLLGNAIKFTSVGDVVLTCKLGSIDSEFVQVVLSVKDSGIGIRPAIVDNLFQAFTQADESTTRKFGGTGLGLAICRQLCEAMGGEINVTSRVDHGSEFVVTLPLRLQPGATASCAPESEILRGRSLLWIGEDRISRNIVETYTRAWGMHIVCANPGDDLTAVLARSETNVSDLDLVVVDVARGECPANDLGELLNNRAEFDTTDRLLLAWEGNADDLEAAQARGFKSLLRKPVLYRQFFEKLAAVTDLALPAEQTISAVPKNELLSSVRALVVDDNEFNVQIAARMLTNLNHKVETAENGYQALELMSRTKFDIVFMDCEMPELDGYSTTREIRRLEQEKGAERIPVVALTAYAMKGDRERCLDAGMDDYLAKPVSSKALETAVADNITRLTGSLV